MEPPSSEIFSLLLSGQVDKLWTQQRDRLKPYLPFICSVAFSPPPLIPNNTNEDEEYSLIENQEMLHSLLCDIEDTNTIKNYFKLDFIQLRSDALKEQGSLRKLGPEEARSRHNEEETEERLAIVFERGNEEKRFRLLLKELLQIMNQVINNVYDREDAMWNRIWVMSMSLGILTKPFLQNLSLSLSLSLPPFLLSSSLLSSFPSLSFSACSLSLHLN